MHVKDVGTGTKHWLEGGQVSWESPSFVRQKVQSNSTEWTIFARVGTFWATTLKGDLADAADVLVLLFVPNLILDRFAFFQFPSPSVQRQSKRGRGR